MLKILITKHLTRPVQKVSQAPTQGAFLCYHSYMKNTHIEHPEDSILTGDLSVLDWFIAESNISAKIDGAPAIVWGTNPSNGKFL